MFNFIHLADKLSPLTINKAINLYNLDIKNNIDNIADLKNYLLHLNGFFNTYFLIKFNKDFEKYSLKNEEYIFFENDFSLLSKFGESILLHYSDNLLKTLEKNNHLLVKRTLDIINNKYDEKVTLKQISDNLHISKNYLCYLFKKETGYKFCEYINILRVNKAKNLIKQDKKTFDFISFDCGFSSQSHFSTTFKKYTGLTPNQFKKSCKQ